MSLSIFGAVGGPLFGMFTLGMFTLRGNQRVKSSNDRLTLHLELKRCVYCLQGAIAGVLVSLILVLWIAFGTPKPKPVTLPFSIEGCSEVFSQSLANQTTPADIEYDR